MTEPISVLLVDDHATMRMGFRMILEASGITVSGEAGTGEEAIHSVRGMRPDVVFMDVQMPDLDGIEATRRIRADLGDSGPRIVIVTTFDRDDYLFSALEAGASGFLLKNAGPEELVNAARVAASGEALLAPEVTRRVIERFAAQGRADAGSGQAQSPSSPERTGVTLTEREADVLRLLARAMSNAEIAAELYIGDATVKTHVSNVLLKLAARDRVAAVVWAHQHGYA
ncbi:MAG: response regulator [Microbacteriaceae bacterium]|uniref:response regulator n=1 Tax=unclassified Microbacterium TaxID=2609290 RepID=UPI00097F4FEF|nr:response regulator transcription factor [Microbacterium sp. JB110]RCS60887.1 DNA-binding response regulator [Microbacterium sp. JB110]SJM64237.1 DNA-binding response regulator, LuxR family [Frigoribacterium sp. JB110]